MITLRTQIGKEFVHYFVERADGIVWERRVYFGRTVATRPSGAAFKLAAKEQERQAALAMGDGERVEEVLDRTMR